MGGSDELDAATGLPAVFQTIVLGDFVYPARISKETEAFIGGLLSPIPTSRLGCNRQRGVEELQTHPFLSSVEWKRAVVRRLKPPSRPLIKPVHADDVPRDGKNAFEVITKGTNGYG